MDAKKPLQHPEEDCMIKVIIIKESYLVLKTFSTLEFKNIMTQEIGTLTIKHLP
jgi:hypothetical protein